MIQLGIATHHFSQICTIVMALDLRQNFAFPQYLDNKLTEFHIIMLHIKLKRMEHRAPHKHIFFPYTHPWPLGLGQKVKTFLLLKVVMLHIKMKVLEHRVSCKHIYIISQTLW